MTGQPYGLQGAPATGKGFPGLPQRAVAAAVAAPTVAPYVRPVDWLPLNRPVAGDQKFVGLLAITNDGSNFVALACTGAYTVDWGDGSAPVNVASGVQANYQYVWANVSAATLCSRGYRQVIVTVTMQAGQTMTVFALQRKHTQAGLLASVTPWLDIAVNGAAITSLQVGGSTTFLGSLESVWIGEQATTGLGSLFSFCYALQSVNLFDTSAVTSFTSMFANCRSLLSIPLFNTSSGVIFSSMFASCYALQSVPLLNTAAGTNFSAMFNACAGITTIPLLNTAAGLTFTGMFTGCSSLQTIPLLNTAAAADFSNMFSNCASLRAFPQLNTAAGTVFTGILTGAPTVAVGRLNGTTRSISYLNCKMSAAEINDMFTGLGTAAGTQTVTTTGNWGSATSNPSIATAKGWTVQG